MTRRKRLTKTRASLQTVRAPRTAKEFSNRTARFQDQWTRIAHVVSRMREGGTSLQQAAREQALTSRTVLRWAKSALRRLPNGRYVARPADRLLRVLVVPAEDGLREVAVRHSYGGAVVADYSNAVQRFLSRGDSTALRNFAGTSILDADGVSVPLLTDLDALTRLGNAGVLSFESIYKGVR